MSRRRIDIVAIIRSVTITSNRDNIISWRINFTDSMIKTISDVQIAWEFKQFFKSEGGLVNLNCAPNESIATALGLFNLADVAAMLSPL